MLVQPDNSAIWLNRTDQTRQAEKVADRQGKQGDNFSFGMHRTRL